MQVLLRHNILLVNGALDADDTLADIRKNMILHRRHTASGIIVYLKWDHCILGIIVYLYNRLSWYASTSVYGNERPLRLGYLVVTYIQPNVRPSGKGM